MYDAQDFAKLHAPSPCISHTCTDTCTRLTCPSHAGEDFYGMYDAQDFAKLHAPELGMQTVPSLDVVYTEERGYVTNDQVCSVCAPE